MCCPSAWGQVAIDKALQNQELTSYCLIKTVSLLVAYPSWKLTNMTVCLGWVEEEMQELRINLCSLYFFSWTTLQMFYFFLNNIVLSFEHSCACLAASWPDNIQSIENKLFVSINIY